MSRSQQAIEVAMASTLMLVSLLYDRFNESVKIDTSLSGEVLVNFCTKKRSLNNIEDHSRSSAISSLDHI